MTEKNCDYKLLKKRHAPTSSTPRNVVFAFLIGGAICALGQIMFFIYTSLGLDEKNAYTLVTVSLIFLSSLLTALGVFDKVARYGGAGTLLPVTGFANSVTSSAIDSRSEGFIFGVGIKIFSVAGPVILYSTLAGTIYGFVYFLFHFGEVMI